ncbi:MAG: amidophosphoribosyltransferase [Anaeromicrobium sp.]|jgi:amidophosphoribosyltransferase|uniref:amidophosphoribosyltransferase n=1 Tax=Anaeromicrobium sp. TaxID=1929132 RepID=UPI0025EE1630|nr:amidophosphoribosyltransferase [Anaeromicrobium sp.]MCT4594541.1 amidophosphoribosyltransferase [Anaeromicrobium sp.]
MTIDEFNDKFKEECGILGVFLGKKENVETQVYSGLLALQHRGQESCGISYRDNNEIKNIKKMGLVDNLFEGLKINTNLLIGHVRYSTWGESNIKNTQPLFSNNISLAHNGTLTNGDHIKENLMKKGIKFSTDTDSEVILKVFEEEGIKGIYNRIRGSYGVVIMKDDELIAMRDPLGIRPVCLGKIEDGYIVASESCAIEAMGGSFIRDLMAGEVIKIDENGVSVIRRGSKSINTCAFEYIYFAREDSKIDGISVGEIRTQLGKILGKEDFSNDHMVMGVPDTGTLPALGYAYESNLKYEPGILRNKYVGRTFICPNNRKNKVNDKFFILKDRIREKDLIVVDDSLVRGTTSKELIKKLKKAGANRIHYRVASPIIRCKCDLGINMKNENIIGHFKQIEEIREEIGADTLKYISTEDLISILGKNICTLCFTNK